MKPFYHLAPGNWTERAFHAFFPIWRSWLKRQSWPDCNVVQAIIGYGTELFERAGKQGVLKVVDCPNSHPITYYGIPQSEYDIWCPGARVHIPHWMFARMNRELQRADVVLCPSTFVRDTMIQFGVPPEKCFVNPFGADTSIFVPRPAVPEVPRFIIVGNIGLRKGHHYLFAAFQQVKRALPSAELICVGTCLDNFRREWRRWKGTFTHHSHLPHGDLAKLHLFFRRWRKGSPGSSRKLWPQDCLSLPPTKAVPPPWSTMAWRDLLFRRVPSSHWPRP